MLLTSYDPFARDFNRLAGRWSGLWDGQAALNRGFMPMDATRTDDEVVLRFDVPGIDSESIEVTVDRGVLSVRARRAEEHSENGRRFIRERVAGTFTRSVRLGDALDADKIEAAYADGVLTVRVPLAEQAKPRKVEIKTTDAKAIKS
jgi:HSP20 family protein